MWHCDGSKSAKAMAAQVARAYILTEVLRSALKDPPTNWRNKEDADAHGCVYDDQDDVADKCGTPPWCRRQLRAKPGGVCFRSLSFSGK